MNVAHGRDNDGHERSEPNRQRNFYPLHRHRFEDVRIDVERRRALDPQRLALVAREEDQADLTVAQDVAEAEDQPIADPLRNQEVALVIDLDEPRRISLRRDVDAAICIDRRNDREGGSLDGDRQNKPRIQHSRYVSF